MHKASLKKTHLELSAYMIPDIAAAYCYCVRVELSRCAGYWLGSIAVPRYVVVCERKDSHWRE